MLMRVCASTIGGYGTNDKQKVHQYYTINGLIRLKIEESGQAKIITYMVDLQNLFSDVEIHSL